MSALKRNIVLSNKHSKNNEMAILTLEKLSSGNFATLKLFNIWSEDLMLAISSNGHEIYKNKIYKTNGENTIRLDKSFDINAQISCVIVSITDNAVKPIVWDSVNKIATDEKLLKQNFLNTPTDSGMISANTGKFAQTQQSYLAENKKAASVHLNTLEEMKENKYPANEKVFAPEHEFEQPEKAVKPPLNLDEMFELEDAQEIEDIIDRTISVNNTPATNPVFKEETELLLKNSSEKEIFIDLINDQIEDMFAKYPSEEHLEALIPNSKWAKINFENDDHHYVLGLIYDDIALKYICYGVPGEFENTPPKDVELYSQWLPLDPNDTSAGGYWVMYQDAITGDNIQIELV